MQYFSMWQHPLQLFFVCASQFIINVDVRKNQAAAGNPPSEETLV